MVDAEGRLAGVMTRSGLAALASAGGSQKAVPQAAPVVAYSDETLRAAAERMATQKVFVLPVIERATGKVVGLLNAEDVLQGRAQAYQRENRQVRVRQPFRRTPRAAATCYETE